MRTSILHFLVISILLVAVLGSQSCDSRLSKANLQQKLDSIAKVEMSEHLKLQGIDLEAYNPVKAFMDSLNLQTLPVRYSADLVEMLPRFTEVPPEIAAYWQLKAELPQKAIVLPESLGTKLLLIATCIDEGVNLLWLLSLDDDFRFVDKLPLYIPQLAGELADQRVCDFSITSDYVIHVREFVGDTGSIRDWTYIVAPDRHFRNQ